MKQAKVFVDRLFAGWLEEIEPNKRYRFRYDLHYKGPSVSLEMPCTQQVYEYDRFPPFFEGLLPEGIMLAGLLRAAKLDQNDFMGQLIAVGHDLVGNVTVEAYDESLSNNV